MHKMYLAWSWACGIKVSSVTGTEIVFNAGHVADAVAVVITVSVNGSESPRGLVKTHCWALPQNFSFNLEWDLQVSCLTSSQVVLMLMLLGRGPSP